MRGSKRVFTCTILHIILSVMCPASGLRDVRLTVPVAVRRGGRVKLSCDYDLEDAQLYSVKWYRGDQEFFRFVPREEPHTQVFPYPGVNVDVSLSGARGLVLRDVQPDLTGVFKCEVSADAPLFHTIIREAAMVIADPPDGIPLISIEDGRLQFATGETLRANCTSPSSFPAANLTWYINGRQVEETYVRRYPLAKIYKDDEEATEEEDGAEAVPGGAGGKETAGSAGTDGGAEVTTSSGGANSTVEKEEDVLYGPLFEAVMETSVVGLEVRLDNATLFPPPTSHVSQHPAAVSIVDKGELPHPGAALLRLRCLATLFTLYRRTTEVELVVLPSSAADEFSPKIAPVLHEEAQQSNQSSGRWRLKPVLLIASVFGGILRAWDCLSRSSTNRTFVTFLIVALHELNSCDPG
ncbi:uncharacterized protein LOC124165676 [Ischnura elegans]|uniref:uncharacterized protein LOC124165676 n=1 Tax=Ischnura elegans TaxID=197161 RepID=UPI001ED897D3|nr:uncharacterized protein LOC124165676 [Ischnura elegans]